MFRFGPDGAFTNIYSFTEATDGGSPASPLLQGTDGYLYGTAQTGGTDGNGTVFRVSLAGIFTNLYSFITGSGGPSGAFANSLVPGTTAISTERPTTVEVPTDTDPARSFESVLTAVSQICGHFPAAPMAPIHTRVYRSVAMAISMGRPMGVGLFTWVRCLN